MLPLDLVFPVVGVRLPCDHNYLLYAALSRLLPCLHDGSLDYSLVPVTGRYRGCGELQLDPAWSRFRLRVAAEEIPRVLPLAGKRLQILGESLRLGVPQVHSLRPTPTLHARTVTIKNATEPDTFLAAVHRRLTEIGVRGRPDIPRAVIGKCQGEPQRHVLRIKTSCVVGYSLLVHDLPEEDSLKLLAVGLGGRRRMGGGVFMPVSEEDGE
jgi:CRISPR-associated protein Cas6